MKTMLQVATATDVGRVRRKNEDFVAAVRVSSADGREFALWLVADGVGGGPQGDVASRTAVEAAIEFLRDQTWNDPVDALREAFIAANSRVYGITGTGEAATTLVAALVADSAVAPEPGAVPTGAGAVAPEPGADPTGAAAWVANVGDSRAYLIADGKARPVTTDHSLVAARVAAGLITDAEARVAPDRNVVTRAIGSEPGVHVDIFGVRPLLPGERLLLCSDGIHGMIEDAAIARIASGADPSEIPRRLVDAANQAGGRDNATALVGWPTAVPEVRP
jgi:serine/threonine protein phosphatase PrpC